MCVCYWGGGGGGGGVRGVVRKGLKNQSETKLMTREQKETSSRTTVRPNKDNIYQALINRNPIYDESLFSLRPEMPSCNSKRHIDCSLIIFALLAHVDKKSL